MKTVSKVHCQKQTGWNRPDNFWWTLNFDKAIILAIKR